MRNLLIYISALTTLHDALALRHGSSQFRDLQAFPKYEVQFLNHLPIAESDAAHCEHSGVEEEEEWLGVRAPWVEKRRLGDGGDVKVSDKRLDIVRMALAPPGASIAQPYLCLMPHPNTTESQLRPEEDEVEVPIDPAESWAALSHLDGQCLYVSQGWFTYAYCHNSHLRQFRAAKHSHPHPPGGYIPEEDPEFDAYTLGQAHSSPKKGRGALPAGRKKVANPAPARREEKGNGPARGTPPGEVDRSDAPAPLTSSSTLGTSSRYLVQRWSDGTRCDKTGRPRETEIQIHCNSASTDRIYLIKELAICSYVMIIHSPHLCSLPGFKAETADVNPAAIRCRRVLGDDEFERWHSESEAGQLLPIDGAEEGQGDIRPSAKPEGLGSGTPRAGIAGAPASGGPDPVLHAEGAEAVEAAHERGEGPSLKELIQQALQRKQALLEGATGAGAGDGEGEDEWEVEMRVDDGSAYEVDENEEVLVFSLQEDEDGRPEMVLETAGQGRGREEARGEDGEVDRTTREAQMNDKERQMILMAVRDFLGSKDKDKGKKKPALEKEEREGRERDEL